MIFRPSNERGYADHGWLKARHTFSFADYYDANFRGFSVLRVINEDRVQAGAGFGTHPHKDMEIITYMISGCLEHKDSMGNGSIIYKDEFQYMSAGSGVTHSEVNPSKSEEAHLLQIWIHTNAKGASPRYDQKKLSQLSSSNGFVLAASPDGDGGSIAIRQDARLYHATFKANENKSYDFAAQRSAWIHVIDGHLTIGSQKFSAGDSAGIASAATLELKALDASRCLLFDLPSL